MTATDPYHGSMNNTATTTAHYTVCVREWFDRTYGNTYHTIRIVGHTEQGHEIDTVLPVTYGHGELTYLQNASFWLGISREDFRLMTWEQRRAMFTLDIVPVRSKKDLHKAGK